MCAIRDRTPQWGSFDAMSWFPDGIRNRFPVYFISTDASLAPQPTLGRHSKRWACEVDNWYHHERVGLGDFRLQSFEAIQKYWAVALLAWGYVQWRTVQDAAGRTFTPAAIIRRHRAEHMRQRSCLRSRVLATGDVGPCSSLPTG
jgi:hypothetical protein